MRKWNFIKVSQFKNLIPIPASSNLHIFLNFLWYCSFASGKNGPICSALKCPELLPCLDAVQTALHFSFWMDFLQKEIMEWSIYYYFVLVKANIITFYFFCLSLCLAIKHLRRHSSWYVHGQFLTLFEHLFRCCAHTVKRSTFQEISLIIPQRDWYPDFL